NVALGDVTRYFAFKGPSSMVIGENSLCYALELLQADEARVVVCGAVEQLAGVGVEDVIRGRRRTRAELLPGEGDGTEVVKWGEVAAVLILERWDAIAQRGAVGRAEVLAYESVGEPNNGSLEFRTRRSFLRSMAGALDRSAIDVHDVGLVIGCALNSFS